MCGWSCADRVADFNKLWTLILTIIYVLVFERAFKNTNNEKETELLEALKKLMTSQTRKMRKTLYNLII